MVIALKLTMVIVIVLVIESMVFFMEGQVVVVVIMLEMELRFVLINAETLDCLLLIAKSLTWRNFPALSLLIRMIR